MRRVVGRVIAAHGVRGEVRILPEDADADLTGRTVLAGSFGEFEVLRQRSHPRGRILQLRSVTDRSAAEALVGQELSAESDSAPMLQEGRFYVHEILGLRVLDEEGAEIGRITGVEPKPAHDIWVAQGPDGTYLIPAVRATVLEVDRELGRITVRGGGVLGPDAAR